MAIAGLEKARIYPDPSFDGRLSALEFTIGGRKVKTPYEQKPTLAAHKAIYIGAQAEDLVSFTLPIDRENGFLEPFEVKGATDDPRMWQVFQIWREKFFGVPNVREQVITF